MFEFFKRISKDAQNEDSGKEDSILFSAEKAKELSNERREVIMGRFRAVSLEDVVNEIEASIKNGWDFVYLREVTMDDDVKNELKSKGYKVSDGRKDRGEIYINW